MIWINIATTAKRLHDRNRSGWWTVAVIIVGRLSYVYHGLFFGLYFGVDLSSGKELLLVMSAVALSLLQTWVIIELFFMIGTDGIEPVRIRSWRVSPPARPGGRASAQRSGFSRASCRSGPVVDRREFTSVYLFGFNGRINRARMWLSGLTHHPVLDDFPGHIGPRLGDRVRRQQNFVRF